MVGAPRSPIDVVRAFLPAMERLDFDAALTLVADTCESANVPLATVHGLAGIRRILEPFFAPTLENVFGSCARPPRDLSFSWTGSTATGWPTTGWSCP